MFQLFSHGKPGQLLINGQWMKAPEIAAWLRTSLPAGTEHLNLYGCEFAQGEEGQQAVQTLQQLLGVSVAASDDVTGQGGDWDLEVGRPLAALRVEDYAHSLQCTGPAGDCDGDLVLDFNDLDDDNDGILDTAEGYAETFFWGSNPVLSGSSATGTVNGIAYTYTDTSTATLLSTNGYFNYSTFPASYGIPNHSNTIRSDNAGVKTITFASPVLNPIFVFSSIGRNDALGLISVPIQFSAPINVLWSTNVVQNSATQITGAEGYAIVQLTGTFTTVSFNYLTPETYVNFGFGANTAAAIDTDKDGIPDYQDRDSDNDSCAGVIEGGANFVPGASYITSNRLNTTVNTSGVPGVPSGTSGYTQAAGQTVGDSLVATQVVVNTAPTTFTVTTASPTATFSISTTATDTTVFSAGTPTYSSGTNADANTRYQWYLGNPASGGTALADNTIYSGTTSSTLNISNVKNLIGNTYYVVVTQTNYACPTTRSAQLLSSAVDLAITKTNNLPGTADLASDTLTRGATTSYQIVVTNNGPMSVTGATVTDTASGLTCGAGSTLTCSPPASPGPTACPATLPTPAQFISGTAVTLGALPVDGTVTFNLNNCTVN